MDLLRGFREPERAARLLRIIRREAGGDYRFMEVCGGHTTAIHSQGIRGLLPGNIRLLSGPGCPVCVTSKTFIDHAVMLATLPDVIIATFGDLLRVPGNHTTLDREKAAGAAITIVYSVIEALHLAISNATKKIVFLAIGFETTSPGNALAIKMAAEKRIGNFFILPAQKVMPPAMKAVAEGGTRINGFICPGHVSAITGSGIYRFLSEDYGIGCVISGFEPVDILQSLLMLIRQVNSRSPQTEVQYSRAVTPEGNIRARKLLEDVFRVSDDRWRGFGIIPRSGLRPGEKYGRFDAAMVFPRFSGIDKGEDGCICGSILRGLAEPGDCPLFGTACTPVHPVGPCMVSDEGACHACHKYSRKIIY